MISSNYLKKYPLITWATQKVLRTSCKKVHSINHEIKEFASLLLYRMHEYDGVWIAAPQVWRSIKMAAFVTLDTSAKDPWQWTVIHEEIMINPEIIALSKSLETDEEGCLSLPGEQWRVARPSRATIQWINLKGKKVVRKVEWFNARIMLHEIDHLNGVLFIDKIT